MPQDNPFFPTIRLDMTDKSFSAIFFFFPRKAEILIVDIDAGKSILKDHPVFFPSLQSLPCRSRRVGTSGNGKVDAVIFIFVKGFSLLGGNHIKERRG